MINREVPVIFNSRDEQFKNPVGAIQAGYELSLVLLSSKKVGAVSAKTVVIFDKDKCSWEYEMLPAETEIVTDDYVSFTVNFEMAEKGLYWYYFVLKTNDRELIVGRSGGENRAVICDKPSAWQQSVYKRSYSMPDWVCGGVFYHIFVDRFYRSGERVELPDKINREDWGGRPDYLPNQNGRIMNNDFFGGNLPGIREKLPYLKGLGVTCLYLSPIFEAFSNHKYDTGDYTRIDPMFGTEQDFIDLCRNARELGIHVICDGVFAHTGSDSVYFDKNGTHGGKGAYGNPNSKYRDWYFFHPDENYETWWGIDTLPRINKDNAAYNEFINGRDGIVRRWLRDGADGWRLDVADELPNRFIESIAKAAKSEKRDALIIGEVWEDASIKISYGDRKNYFEGDKLDSVMNYPFKDAIIDFVKNGNSFDIKSTVESIVENYPEEVVHCLMNMLGTHDTPRILTALADRQLPLDASREDKAGFVLNDVEKSVAVKRLKIASVIQMTLPGVPCVYYGDEAETEGCADPFNRSCFPWGHENQDLQDWYKMVIGIRTGRDVYKRGKYRTVAAFEGLYAFERYDRENRLITAANCGEREQIIIVHGTWKDLLTGKLLRDNITAFPGEVLLLEKVEETKKQKGGILNGIQRTFQSMDK